MMEMLKWVNKRIIQLEERKKRTPKVSKKINLGAKARAYKEVRYELEKLGDEGNKE